MPDFIPGLELCRRFYLEAVAPILAEEFSGLRYSAALIGSGSEVLGFDTPMSADHHWGPRAMLFLGPGDYDRAREEIRGVMASRLPRRFLGYPTNFTAPDLDDKGVQLLQDVGEGPINHRVETFTIRGFFLDYLGFDVDSPLEPADWLTFPAQKLRTIAAGAVYRDDLGLAAVRDRLAWYPHDLWLYVMAAGWGRIGQEEHLMGRAGFAGDEIGSALIAARLVRDIMRLCFLMERQYAPYAKWFGTAFAALPGAAELAPPLSAALAAETWPAREESLAAAYAIIARRHNALGLTEPLPDEPSPFFTRPFLVIRGERFANALLARITDPAVRRIADRSIMGSIDLFSDNTDVLGDPSLRGRIRALYS